MRRSALVIGGGSAIGRAVVRALNALGTDVLFTSSHSSRRKELETALNGSFRVLDVTKEQDVHNIFEAPADFDGVIYLASNHYFNSLRNFNCERCLNTLHLNSLGFVTVAKAFQALAMRSPDKRARSLVYVSSIAAHKPEIGILDYSASKALGSGLVRLLSIEMARQNIRVNAVSPGWVASARADMVSKTLGDEKVAEIRKRYPLGLGKPEQVAETVVFLVSEQSSWLTGQDLLLDGGRCLS